MLFAILKKVLVIFYNKHKECKPCITKRSLKRYYEKKNEIPNSQKLYYEKNREKLLQKQNDRYITFKELHRSYIDFKNKLKALEEKSHTQQIEI